MLLNCVSSYSRLIKIALSPFRIRSFTGVMLLAALKALKSNVADEKAEDLKTASFTQ